jgi:hypothetical protein
MCVDVPSPDHKSRRKSISLAMAGNRRSLSLSPSLSSQPRAPSPAAPLSVFSSCSSSPSPVQQRVRDSGFHLLCGLHSPAASVANRRLIGAPSVQSLSPAVAPTFTRHSSVCFILQFLLLQFGIPLPFLTLSLILSIPHAAQLAIFSFKSSPTVYFRPCC